MCSSYVATKLKTWSDNGLKRLRLLLAKMGIALAECQQKFQYMSSDMKKRMKEEFQKLLPEYGLTDLYYRSFQRLHGYSSKVSAADVVYGVSALLESWGGKAHQHRTDPFWSAYKALSLNNLEDLQLGMQRAINVQRATLRQGSIAITKKGFIKSARGFRWLKLEDGADAELLAHPLSLTKLCYFLMDALREKGARAKPMICAALRPGSELRNMVLIVGVSSRPRLGAQHANRFGMAFRSVARDLGASFTHDAFESSWIQLDVSAVNAFMIQISDKL
jgi:cell division control protein 45